MRAILQRVSKGSVSVDGKLVADIGLGYVVLLGVGQDDTQEKARELAEKTVYLRVFGDDEGKMNRSLLDVAGEMIVVSQFTLHADTSRGRRPSFINAAKPELAEPLVDYFIEQVRGFGVQVQSGIFGAHMVVDIQNDGPVTVTLEN
ncbi:MAG: D-tyrosyl-tRNA(Tyr) deacylase [Chloroflexi bacterium]|jgi:D-tyrosyl-tRNA(Tyr) deacylase|nr:D-tyrosyl-tRNA(Tyr) deacylase [Chloroflexota bacterium]